MLSSLVVVASGVARGDLAALFSEANIDNGRPFGPVDPREVGRCCHESVPARARGIAALGDAVEDNLVGFDEG